jgi:SpoIVB peptidase S55
MAFLVVSGRPAAAAPATIPPDSLRAGMAGIGYSVFQDTRIDSFGVTILGVLKGNRPGGDLILGRAQGAYLERTGIIAGMSGSPVYVNGRLIGAIAFAWPFNKDPIAGITPIRDMLGDLRQTAPEPGGEPDDRYGSLGAPPTRAAAYPGGATPIATPIALAGFTPEATAYLGPWLAERGLVATAGGAPLPGGSCDSIVPGAAVGVQLIRGDWNATAIGTATYRDGNRVLAFGHPFFALGQVRLPLTAVTIQTVMPSQQISNKVGSATRVCGTLVADRSVGVAGVLGPPPSMVPVSVTVAGPAARSRHYHFEVARSRFLTPGLIAATIVNSISEALYDVGPSTTRYEVTYHLDGGTAHLTRGNSWIVPTPLSGPGEEVNVTLNALLGNRFQPVRVDSVTATVAVTSEPQDAQIAGIRLVPALVAPGDSVRVEVTLRPSRHELERQWVQLRIPESTPPGTLSVRACDATATEQWEHHRAPDRYEARSLTQLLTLLGAQRRADRVYVQLFRAAPGATVHGSEISQAPISMLEVLGSGASSGDTAPTQGATLEEVSIPIGRVVGGCETATLEVLPYRPR